MRSRTVVHQGFLDKLINKTTASVINLFDDPDSISGYRRLGDDGYSNLDRLEMSPLPDDQLFALGIRMAKSDQSHTLHERLTLHFISEPSPVLVDAQRRIVFQNNTQSAVQVGEQLKQIELELSSGESDEKASELKNYADLLADLWCDPRIHAPVHTRAKMLALASACAERSMSLARLLTS